MLPRRRFTPSRRRARRTPRRSRAADRELDSRDPEDALRRVRALSPHIGARAELDGRPVTVWRARARGRSRFVPLEVQPDGGRRMTYDEFLRGPARDRAGAAAAAYGVVRRVFEDEAYADRALPRAGEGLDDRERALAQRLAYGTVQRVRTLDHAIDALGRRPVRKLDPPVLAALRLGAYQLGYLDGVAPHAAANESVELVRAAGLERAVPFTNAVMRRLDASGLARAARRAARGAAQALVPGLDPETWGRDFGEEEALALMRAQNEPPETVVRLVRGEPPASRPDVPGAYRVDARRRASARRGAGLAAEPRLAARRRSPSGRATASAMLDLCAAPGGKATMLAGEVVAVEMHEGRARELRGERRAGSARRTSASSTPTRSSSRPS